MALPQDGQDANGLEKVTEIPAGKELMFIDPTTNAGGIITLENLTKQILNGLKSQAFALNAGQMTILQALNSLNGESLWTEIPGKFTNDKYGFANVFKKAISINPKYSHISWFKVTIDNLDTAIGFSINNGDTKKVIVFIYDRIIVMQGKVSALFIYKIDLTAMAHSENFN